jgi:glycosyltransferase involved in cell wall biosynthesis
MKGFEKVNKDNRFILYTPRRINLNLDPERFLQKIVKSSSWFVSLASLIKKDQVEVFHQFFPRLPPLSSVNIAATVHDLTFDACPSWFPPRVYVRVRTWTTIAALISKLLIAISESTKKDLIKHYKVSAQKVKVIHYGVDHELFKPYKAKDLQENLKKRYGINQKYILYVGDINIRKNTVRMLKAFYKFTKLVKDCQMIIVGREFGRHVNIRKLVSTLNLGTRIKLLGFVCQNDLPLLYNDAIFTVYPSLYEGFGLPLVESMACGTPVITSNTSSMPEVVGKAGIIIDPYDTESLADAMITLYLNNEIRSQCQRRCLERSARFTWERAALETLNAYKSIGVGDCG